MRPFFEEVAFVEFGGPPALRPERLEQMRKLTYDDLSAERNTVAVVQGLEAILQRQAAGQPGGMVQLNTTQGGLVLRLPGKPESEVLYKGVV